MYIVEPLKIYHYIHNPFGYGEWLNNVLSPHYLHHTKFNTTISTRLNSTEPTLGFVGKVHFVCKVGILSLKSLDQKRSASV